MDLMNILAFLLVASLLVVSPGPNGVLIAKTVPTSGRRAGFLNVLGFVAAFYIHGSLSILGISILLVQSSLAFFIFKMVGVGYLIWVGIKALYSAWGSEQVSNADSTHGAFFKRGAFIEGFLTNALNPKVSMFYLAAFPQFLNAGESAVPVYVLVSLHALVNLIWFSSMVVLLASLNSFARSQRFNKWLKTFTGAVLIGFGAKLATLKPLNSG